MGTIEDFTHHRKPTILWVFREEIEDLYVVFSITKIIQAGVHHTKAAN